MGIECCGFHMAWTKKACPKHEHNFFADDTFLTLAALREGKGLADLPCFTGEPDPTLVRFCPHYEAGLVLHREKLRATFNDFLQVFKAACIDGRTHCVGHDGQRFLHRYGAPVGPLGRDGVKNVGRGDDSGF